MGGVAKLFIAAHIFCYFFLHFVILTLTLIIFLFRRG